MELIERDATLDHLRRLLRSAETSGHVALVGAEAGAGKTSVLRVLADSHSRAGGTVWWGACDALNTPHPLAPLFDIARDASPRFVATLKGPRPALFDAVLDELRHAAGPLLLVVEDAHWADEATLDMLKFVGRRIERTHALLVISYRDDEVGATHPLRQVIGELPQSLRSAVPVPRLSEAAVQAMLARSGHQIAGLFEATLGNAFFVTEVLRDGTALTSLHAGVPQSVRDVVLARVARLPERVQELLKVVAVVPGRVERWLIDAMVTPTLAEIEAALASGLLVTEGDQFAYRHELGRVAVESTLSIPMRQHLHARILAILEKSDRDNAPARLVHHAVIAQDAGALARHGPRAAGQAITRGATREAVAHWNTTLRLARPVDEHEEKRWLEAALAVYSRAGHVQGREAACVRLESLARQRGDIASAAVVISQRAMCWASRNDLARALAINADALTLVEPMAASAEKVSVWRTEAWLNMLDRNCELSLEWSRRTWAIAEALDLEEDKHALQHLMACDRLLLGDASGFTDLRSLADAHRAAGRLVDTVGCLANLGSGSGEVMRFDVAEPALREAVALAQALEMDGQHDYARAWLAMCRLHQGDWREAGLLAEANCSRPGVTEMSRLMSLVSLGRLRVRRGDPGAKKALDEALQLAGAPGTLQRLAPVLAARAELAFEQGDLEAVQMEAAAGLALAQAKSHPWFIGELAYWLWRVDDRLTPPPGAAAPWMLQMTGRWREAADAWADIGCPYEQARALADGDALAKREALEMAEALSARPLVDRLRRELHRLGVRGLSRGPRASTQANPAGLTAAEHRVLLLMGQGLRNTAIAAELHRSVRTIDHQVAAVIAKLGVASRAEAVDRARREGWLDPARAAPAGAI